MYWGYREVRGILLIFGPMELPCYDVPPLSLRTMEVFQFRFGVFFRATTTTTTNRINAFNIRLKTETSPNISRTTIDCSVYPHNLNAFIGRTSKKIKRKCRLTEFIEYTLRLTNVLFEQKKKTKITEGTVELNTHRDIERSGTLAYFA